MKRRRPFVFAIEWWSVWGHRKICESLVFVNTGISLPVGVYWIEEEDKHKPWGTPAKMGLLLGI